MNLYVMILNLLWIIVNLTNKIKNCNVKKNVEIMRKIILKSGGVGYERII